MVESDGACIFSPLVTREEWAKIPSETAKKIENYVSEKFEEFLTSKALFETNKFNSEQNLTQLQDELKKLTEENVSLKAKLELSTKTIQTLEEQISTFTLDFSKLQSSCHKLEEEAAEFRHQRNLACDERDEHLKSLQRRNTEIERMKSDIKILMEQLETAVNTKCEAMAKADAVESMKLTLEYKEKRIEQERALLNSQVESLTEDLRARTEELLNMRRDNTSRCIQLETKLSEKTEELKVAVDQVKSLTDINNNLTERIEELTKDLILQKENEEKMSESYLQEIDGNIKLSTGYKNMHEESKKRVDELELTLRENQLTLQMTTERYGELETKHKETLLAHEEILSKKNEYIAMLKTELETANQLLGNIKEMSFEASLQVPSTSKPPPIINTAMSYTELYSKYVSYSDQVAQLQEENTRLNNYIEKVRKEFHENGPYFMKLREDLVMASDLNQELKERNEDLEKQLEDLKDANAVCRRMEAQAIRETKRLERQVTDLSRQVIHLTWEVERSRNGDSLANNIDYSKMANSDDPISRELVTFDDIQELQHNNMKLLSAFRELVDAKSQDRSDEIDDLRNKMERLREEYQELLHEKERDIKTLEMLRKQRDTYKNMYAQITKQSPDELEKDIKLTAAKKEIPTLDMEVNPLTSEQIKQMEKELETFKKQLEHAKAEADAYREEKVANDKMLEDQMETLRKENKELVKHNCKLITIAEVNEEKFKTIKNNMDVLRKQVAALEKQNKIFSDTILKHEQTINYLKDDSLQAHTKLSKTEVLLASLQKENALLKNNESRFLQERETLNKQMHSQNIIQSNIELIKASLERSDSEGKLRLEARLDEAHRECSALRRRLQEEQDRFRQLSEHLQNQTQNALKRSEEEREAADQVRKELGDLREELISKTNQVDELSKKVKLSILAIPESSGDGKRIRQLEQDLDDSKAEIESLKTRLKTAKEASEEYFNIAENAEKQMKLVTDQQDELKVEIEKHKGTIKDLREKIAELEAEISIQLDDQDIANCGKSKSSILQDELNVRTLDLQQSQEQLESCRTECKSLIENLKAAENKYAREVMLHSADLQALTDLKEELITVKNQINELQHAKERALTELEISKNSWKTQEEYLLKEKAEVENRLKDLNSQNALLHDQIETFNSQLTVMQSQINNELNQSGAEKSLNSSLVEDEIKSSEQLLKVIKYLRQEKNIAVNKMEILDAEYHRLKAKFEIVNKELDERKALMENERQSNEISLVTAAKHAEIMRKVETLNAMADSNRSLRQERDSLSDQLSEARTRLEKLETEMGPLQETNIELTHKAEAMQTENVSLRAECNRWRQRANILIEKSSRTSPEDWKKLQNEKETLSKQLTIERANVVKLSEEINVLKQDKIKLEEQLKSIRAQNYAQADEINKLKEEVNSLQTQVTQISQNLEQFEQLNMKLTNENKQLHDEGANKESSINELKNNLMQIRKIAKKYKIQSEDQLKELETLKQQMEEKETLIQQQASLREEQQKSENLQIEEKLTELESKNKETIMQLNQQVQEITAENESKKLEIEKVKQTSQEKEERFKLLFKNAKERILTLTEHNKELQEELKNQPGKSGESAHSELLAKIESLMKDRDDMIADHLQEKERLTSEIDVLNQKISQLQRQLGSQQGSKPSTSSGHTEKSTIEPPTANIKPMAGHSTNTQTQSVSIQPWRSASEPTVASIRPMSAQLRTVAVPPTSQSSNSTVMIPPQQQVHTTGSSNNIEALSSSPTSSNTEYVPATSSAGSSTVVNARQATVPPSQSSQDPEDDDGSPQVHASNPTQQQAVALVLPRVEPPSSASASTQDQGTSSSSSNTVTTTQAGLKRQREADNESCEREEQNKINTQKRTRLQLPRSGTVSDSGLEVEYQVPTSSQRDHDDDNVIVLESDEDGGPDEGEGADDEGDDPYTAVYEDMEGMEQDDHYDDADCPEEDEEAGNEVEVIDDSSEVPNQSERSVQEGSQEEENHEQQQSEAISSGTDGALASTICQSTASQPNLLMFPRSTRPIPPLTRPQQSHLLLPHTMDEGGDDGIVPSTPTLYVPRRSDGFGEAVSSPQVPTSGRFTFSESAPPAGSTASSEVVPEQTLETVHMDENSTGRSVPNTPLGSSPQEVAQGIEEQGPSHRGQADDSPTITVSGVGDDNHQLTVEGSGDMGPPPVAGVSGNNQEPCEEEIMEGDDEVSSEGEKPPVAEDGEEESREAEASPSTNRNNRSVVSRQIPRPTNMGFSRGSPIPIIWGERGEQRMSPQQRQQQAFTRGMSRRSRGRSPFRRF